MHAVLWRRPTDVAEIAIIEVSLQEKRGNREVADEIDRVPAGYYGFTAEELDFIPSTKLRAGNYDIEYRMGREAESEEE